MTDFKATKLIQMHNVDIIIWGMWFFLLDIALVYDVYFIMPG